MNKEELRAKRSAIRKEIKERMQLELEDHKREIKRQVKRENLSVEEKREKYRRLTHEEKIRLMEEAKEEFQARKRMLGEADEDSGYPGAHGESGGARAQENVGDVVEVGGVEDAPGQEPPPWHNEEDMLVDDDDLLHPIDHGDPDGAFVPEDSADELEALRQFESPIGEFDALPAMDDDLPSEPGVEPGFDSDEVEAPSLFYYIRSLIFHPIQTLDEFDDYIAFPSGLRNVAIFYLLSLVPMVISAYVMETVGISVVEEMTEGLAGAALAPQPNILLIYGGAVLSLFLYAVTIAAVNYLFTSEANFVTLLTYFAFVNGVSSVVAYVLVIAVTLAALIFPPLGLLIILVLFGLGIWGFALRIIVLMSTYGYGFIAAFFLNLAVWIAVSLAGAFI